MKKMSDFAAFVLCQVLCVFSVFGCAEMQPQVSAGPGQGTEKIIEMQASSYEFTPNNIRAFRGDTLVFSIANVSDKEHNFTIKGPNGATLKSVDLPVKKTERVAVTLAEAGTYDFYCDKPFHKTFGMKGQVLAEP